MTALTPHAQHLLAHLDAVLDELATLLEGITPAQADAPSPCTDFTVAELRDHVISWLTAFADGFESSSGECSDPNDAVVVGDGAAQVREAASRIHAAIEAGALDRPLVIAGGSVPGEIGLGMILGEYQVHGWDLARATGRTWMPAPAGAETSVEFFDGMLTPEMQGPGQSFGARVSIADDAPALDRLLGITGRDPAWQPA